MRRNDREVTDRREILEILDSCKVCRLAFTDGDEPYIVPVNFGWEEENGKIMIYVHGANEGRKLRLAAMGGKAAFEADCAFEMLEGDTACRYSAKYRSVTGCGRVRIAQSEEEKLHGLSSVMKHMTGKSDWDFDSESAAHTAVIVLELEEIYGKQRV